MFAELLTYDPADIDPAIRAQVADILKARSELLAGQAEVAGLRSRAWSGEAGLTEFIELRSMNLAKLREDNGKKMLALLKVAVDVEGLVELLPSLGIAVLQKFNVPLPVLLEIIGADFDAIKLLVDQGKKLVEDL